MSQIRSDIIYNRNLQNTNETDKQLHYLHITIPIVQDINDTDIELIEPQNTV